MKNTTQHPLKQKWPVPIDNRLSIFVFGKISNFQQNFTLDEFHGDLLEEILININHP